MQTQSHPLEPFFQQAVRNSYEGKLGLNDPDVTGYVAHLLCEFSESDNLYKVRDAGGPSHRRADRNDAGRRPGPRHRALVRRRARPAQAHRRLRALRRRHVSRGDGLRPPSSPPSARALANSSMPARRVTTSSASSTSSSTSRKRRSLRASLTASSAASSASRWSAKNSRRARPSCRHRK